MKKVTCERCGEFIDTSAVKWLELSNTDGNYYVEIPEGHVSQGGFSFGIECATRQLNETRAAIIQNDTAYQENMEILKDKVRHTVLDALDSMYPEHHGWKDSDLQVLFPALDKHSEKLFERLYVEENKRNF